MPEKNWPHKGKVFGNTGNFRLGLRGLTGEKSEFQQNPKKKRTRAATGHRRSETPGKRRKMTVSLRVIPAGATALEITADILASVPPRIPPPGERARLAPVLSERARDNGRRGARRKGTPDS